MFLYRISYRPEYRHDFEILIRTLMCFLNLIEMPDTTNRNYLFHFWKKIDDFIENNPKYSFWTKALEIVRNIKSPEDADELKKHIKDSEWNWHDCKIQI